MFLESLNPSCVIEFIFSRTTAIFQNFMNFFAPYPFLEIAPLKTKSCFVTYFVSVFTEKIEIFIVLLRRMLGLHFLSLQYIYCNDVIVIMVLWWLLIMFLPNIKEIIDITLIHLLQTLSTYIRISIGWITFIPERWFD